ncbi:MAG: cytosolic protein [Anaerolineales bacterium]|nr:cytosolic protein [Anaerolineales bacterium]MCB9172445.1 cytosolic protein [Ardenticatenales bacterium]
MRSIDLQEVQYYVNETIVDFHRRRIYSLESLKLKKLLKKNPYLFRAKNLIVAADLIEGLLEAFLSSSEEKLFGDFLEDLAIFIASKTADGRKSAATGVDLEFVDDGLHYIVSIKSGTNWGNSSQHRKLADDLRKAVATVKQGNMRLNVQPVLGICYGKTRTSMVQGYMKVVGQNFWTLISDDPSLYIKIIEPIGYEAKRHNETFYEEKARIVNRFTAQFIDEFCHLNGAIDWPKLVEWNSGNFDLDQSLPSS